MAQDAVLERRKSTQLPDDSPYRIEVSVRATSTAATLWVFFSKPYRDPLT